ncbi:MAG: hypothetical protein ABGY75_04670, partial [Gemmataceae bacterium]
KATKAPAQSVDQIIQGALVKAAATDTVKLRSAKGAEDGLFQNGSPAPIKAAIEQCLNNPTPLLASAGKQGKDEYARLTRYGLLQVLDALDEPMIGPAAARIAHGLPSQEAIDFANEIIGRKPAAVVELEPLVAEWTAKRETEATERAKRQAEQRERERQAVEAMERYKQTLDTRRANRIAELKRELAELSGTAVPNPSPAPTPPTERPKPTPTPAPKDAKEFVRQEARRLVSAWVDAIRLGKKEGQHLLEVVLGNLSAMSQIGEEGEKVQFDPSAHESDGNISRGSPVTITRPGWELAEDDDARYVVAKARVKPGEG